MNSRPRVGQVQSRTGSRIVAWSGHTTEGCVYGDAPFLKEPFWDIALIPVSLAPDAEFRRRGIHPCRKPQLPGPHFKPSRQSEQRRNGTPPIGVAAFALRSGESNRCRHRPRSYSALGDCAAESSPGWRMVCGSGRSEKGYNPRTFWIAERNLLCWPEEGNGIITS